MENIRTILYDLPTAIKGFTVATTDGFFTIVLNQNLSFQQNKKTYHHEIKHIMRGDYDKKCPVGLIEINAHNANEKPPLR